MAICRLSCCLAGCCWALVEMAVINRAQPDWHPPQGDVPARKDVFALLGAVVVMLVVGLSTPGLAITPSEPDP